MKKLLLVACSAFLAVVGSAQEKISLKTHNQDLITTKTTDYQKWAVFPSKEENIRKIVMKITLGTPIQDTMRCADWDYSDHIYLVKSGGENAPQVNYEMGRMLTPYGGANGKGWAFEWEVDVTDFTSLLRDSVLINYMHTGGEPWHDRGWALSVEFEITKGAPILEPVKIHEVHNGSFPFGDPKDDIENYLTQYKMQLQPSTNMVRSRITQTGHGMDRPDNCAEFCSKWRDLVWDNKAVNRKQLWKQCGDNPLYPQAGTWLYDRANWCPGYLVQPDVMNFFVGGGSKHTYELNMEPYVSQGQANQQLSAYLIEYKANKNSRDVAVSDIIAPSKKQLWGRYNPTVTRPIIVVDNNTAKTVKSLEISYGTEGMETYKEVWTGEIQPFASARIEMKNPLQGGNNSGKFTATVTKVNGGTDQYIADNTFTSAFNPAPTHKGDFVLVFEPNASSKQDNAYALKDSKGRVIVEKKLGEIEPGKIYAEPISLPPGDYEFTVSDKGGNGLEFWADREGGNGRVYILNNAGELVKFFDPDFGNELRYQFTVNPALAKENLDMTPAFWLDKTTTEGDFSIKLLLNNKEDKIKVSIVNYDSKPEAIFTITPPEDGIIKMNVSPYVSGRHFVIVEQNGNKYLRRVARTPDRRDAPRKEVLKYE